MSAEPTADPKCTLCQAAASHRRRACWSCYEKLREANVDLDALGLFDGRKLQGRTTAFDVPARWDAETEARRWLAVKIIATLSALDRARVIVLLTTESP